VVTIYTTRFIFQKFCFLPTRRLFHYGTLTELLLSAFAKLQKRLLASSCLSVCLCVEQFGSHRTDFHEILCLSIFRKSREISSLVKIGQDHLAQFFLEWEMFQTKVVEKIKVHILCSGNFFFENRAVYEIMSKNIVEPEKTQMIIWCMHISCWVPKATNTNSEYCFSTATIVVRTRLNVTSYANCL
jgi:hypothetical protein